jgi:hypothetical protein
MREKPGVIYHGAKIAEVDPTIAFGTTDVIVRRLRGRPPKPLIMILAFQIGSHRAVDRSAGVVRERK